MKMGGDGLMLTKGADEVLYAKELGKDKGFYFNMKANFRIGDLVEPD